MPPKKVGRHIACTRCVSIASSTASTSDVPERALSLRSISTQVIHGLPIVLDVTAAVRYPPGTFVCTEASWVVARPKVAATLGRVQASEIPRY